MRVGRWSKGRGPIGIRRRSVPRARRRFVRSSTAPTPSERARPCARSRVRPHRDYRAKIGLDGWRRSGLFPRRLSPRI